MWKKELERISVSKNFSFKRGELTDIFTELGKKHTEDPNKIKNYFYRVTKKLDTKPKDPKNATTDDKNETDKEMKENVISKKLSEFKHYPFEFFDVASLIDTEKNEYLPVRLVADNLNCKNEFLDYIDIYIKEEKVSFYHFHSDTLAKKNDVMSLLDSFGKFTTSIHNLNEVTEMISVLKASDYRLDKMRLQRDFDALSFEDIIEIKVDKIIPYGVITKYVKNENIIGFIHISQIINGYVDDIHFYFKEDMTLKARVIAKKENYKLDLSTKNMYESEGIQLIGKEKEIIENSKVADQTQDNELSEKISSQEVTAGDISAELTDEVSASNDVEEKVSGPSDEDNDILLSKELKEFEGFLENIAGPISVSAKDKLRELVNRYGIFLTSVTLTQVNYENNLDLGLILLEKTESKIKECL